MFVSIICIYISRILFLNFVNGIRSWSNIKCSKKNNGNRKFIFGTERAQSGNNLKLALDIMIYENEIQIYLLTTLSFQPFIIHLYILILVCDKNFVYQNYNIKIIQFGISYLLYYIRFYFINVYNINYHIIIYLFIIIHFLFIIFLIFMLIDMI